MGPTLAVLTLPMESDGRFGAALGAVGDLDDDGVCDLVVGAPERTTPSGRRSGSAFAFSTGAATLLFVVAGDVGGDGLGSAITGLGDLNGDGIPDFAVGASSGGYVRVYSGTGTTMYTLTGDDPGAGFGTSLASVDANGDGFEDVVVGEPSSVPGGSVHVFAGPDGALLARFDGEAAHDQLGRGVVGVGDLDGDGFGDIALGSPFSDVAGLDSGRVDIVSVCGTRSYGGGLGGTQAIDLAWSPGPAGAASNGAIALTGAEPLAVGALAVSIGADQFTNLGVVTLVDAAPGSFALFPVAYDLAGAALLPADLTQPLLSGVVLFLQAFATSAAFPEGVAASNAIELLFCP